MKFGGKGRISRGGYQEFESVHSLFEFEGWGN